MSLNLTSQISSVRPLFDYLKKQQENRKFLKSLEITATFVLITFFLIFAVRPTIITIAALKGDIESKKILKEDLKNKINQVIIAQDKFSQVQERYSVVNSGLPDYPNYYSAASIIEQVGTTHNITIDKIPFNLDLENKKDDPNLKTYGVTVNLNGSFLDTVKMASDIIQDRRTSYIESLIFATAEDQSTGTTIPGTSTSIGTKFSSIFYYWPISK